MKKLFIVLIFFISNIVHAEPFTLLVGFPPGGGQHLIAMIMEEALVEAGHTAVILNKAGAGGVIAMNECTKIPNRNTLCIASQSQLVHADILTPDAIKYDPSSIRYIKLIGESPLVLLTNTKNTKSLEQILQDIRVNKVTFGSGALGNTYVAKALMAHVNSQQGIDVSYKGVGPAITDLMGGHITYAVAPYTAVKNQVENGSIRLVAILDDTSYLKDVPKIPNFYAPSTKFGIVSGKDMADQDASMQERVITQIMDSKIMQQKFKEQGIFIANKKLTGSDYKRLIFQERAMIHK